MFDWLRNMFRNTRARAEELERENLSLRKKNELMTSHLQTKPSTDEAPSERQEENKNELDRAALWLRIDGLKADLSHWKQRAIRGEEIIEQKTNELSAVYKADRDYNDGVTTLFLSHVANIRDIDRAFKTHKGPTVSLAQAGSTIIALAIILYLYFNKPLVAKMVEFIDVPRNQLFLVVGLIVICVIVYLWRRKKSR